MNPRLLAEQSGEKTYRPIKSCRAGHFERYTKTGQCVPCSRVHAQRWRERNPEKHRESQLGFRERNPGYFEEYWTTWYAENQDKVQQYIRDNLPAYRAREAKRRAAKLRAIPPWANLEAIKDFYAACPEGYEVDHIHPLQGKMICGLHVENNLQYLTVRENRSKGNRLQI